MEQRLNCGQQLQWEKIPEFFVNLLVPADVLTYPRGMAPKSANKASLEIGGMQVLSEGDKETLNKCRDMAKRGECANQFFLCLFFCTHYSKADQHDYNPNDMVSRMPDDIVVTILSKLPIKDATPALLLDDGGTCGAEQPPD